MRNNLCDTCVARHQCGNEHITYCASYTKDTPVKWVTTAGLDFDTDIALDEIYKEREKYE